MSPTPPNIDAYFFGLNLYLDFFVAKNSFTLKKTFDKNCIDLVTYNHNQPEGRFLENCQNTKEPIYLLWVQQKYMGLNRNKYG